MNDVITSATSSEVSLYSTNNTKEFEFKLDNGKEGIITVSDPLLDSSERAEARAKSELLQNGYRKKEISFTTYRTDIGLNNIIKIKGILYIVKNLITYINNSSIKTQVVALRYEG